jgi:hypothetical protein
VTRTLLIGGAATVVWLAVASNLPGMHAPAADWSRPKTISTSSGITATYPRGWHATVKGGPSLAFSSFPLPSDWWLEPEHTKTIPEGGVFIWLYIVGPGSNEFPRRPDHFELRDEDRRFMSCGLGFDGWNVIFVDHSATVQAFVGLGRGGRKSDAVQLLDRLTIRRSRPSLPPI